MALRVIQLDIDESLTGDTRVEEIALVLQPAIETEFVYFAEVGERGGIKESPKAPKSSTPNPNPKGEGTAKGDASSTRGAEVSKRVEDILKNKSDDFNERYKDKLGYGVNIGMLKSVYQRGVGAYNVSHSPSVSSAEQWALARVNAFLYLVKEGRPENNKYVGDNDLLPKDHPKAVKMKQSFESYNDYPESVKNNAKKVLAWVEKNGWGSCGTPVGKQRANMLANGENISLETIQRMYSYLSRHKGDLESSKSYEDGCGLLMYDAWGGEEALSWSEKKLAQVEEEMGYDLGDLSPYVSTTGDTKLYEDCGCGCDDCIDIDPELIDKDGNYDDGLYFQINYIDGKPVFETIEEAERYADSIGCKGSHIHTIDGEDYYMPCDIHSALIDKLIEDRGVELEDLLASGYTIVDVNYVDASELRMELKEKFNKNSYDEFYRIVSNPSEFSRLDIGNRTRRFVYMAGFGPELINTSRQFCRRMLGGRQFVFRIEDIEMINAEISAEDSDYKIIPRPKGTEPDIFAYKGGANCRHYWMEVILQPASPYANAPVATNNKRKMIEEAAITLPADAQAGQVNPPVDYGSRSPQSVGLRKAATQAIVVDVDDTLIKGSKPIQKTIDYVNKKWEDYRIIIVSGRQKSRTEETKRELDRLGVKWDEIHLSDFPVGPNASNAFKEYKAKLLIKNNIDIVEAIENDAEARRLYNRLGINSKSPLSLKVLPAGFLQGLAIFELEKDAVVWSNEMGCGGITEQVEYMKKRMFQACSYNLKKKKFSQQFSYDEEKRMLYSPAMKPGILIPRIDEATKERYFVTFTPETIEKMAQRFLIEKRTDKTNYEHSEQKFDGVYLVESWIVNGDQDKAYTLGYSKEEIPKGTWFVGYRIDNDEVWDMIKKGKVKGLSIEGNFEYKLSAIDTDEYLLEEIINIINKIDE